jgi:hypothetical protein
VIGWMLGCLMPRGPYPILALSGEQGSGKTTVTRMLRRSLDPNAAETRARPREERDLLIAARNGWVVAFENLSRIDQELSDWMCRVATGAGFGTRTLYSDLDETLVAVCRPQLVNGIPGPGDRAGLPRPQHHRSPCRPGRRRASSTSASCGGGSTRPRRASWGAARRRRVRARQPGRGGAGATAADAGLRALGGGRGAGAGLARGRVPGRLRREPGGRGRVALEADPVASLVEALMAETRRWEGPAEALLARLRALADDGARRSLPSTGHHLSNRLRRPRPGAAPDRAGGRAPARHAHAHDRR